MLLFLLYLYLHSPSMFGGREANLNAWMFERQLKELSDSLGSSFMDSSQSLSFVPLSCVRDYRLLVSDMTPGIII